jgi:ABC-type multidrug transport system fused ATPase/permease subunit
MSRATADIEAVRNFISQGLLQLFQTSFLIVGIIYLLISLNWRLVIMMASPTKYTRTGVPIVLF